MTKQKLERHSIPWRPLVYMVVALAVMVLSLFNERSLLYIRGQTMGSILQIQSRAPVDEQGQALVSLQFTGNGQRISAALFSIDYDEICLLFDPVDADRNGVPDNVQFHTSTQFFVTASFDATDLDGELDILIADYSPPYASLPDRTLLTIRFTALCAASADAPIEAPVRFSQAPRPSLSTGTGNSAPGTFLDGSVWIAAWTPSTPAPTATATPQGQPTATPAETPSATIPGTIPGTIPPIAGNGQTFLPLVFAHHRGDSSRLFLPLIVEEPVPEVE
ncbi:hypothetical protein [Caldilinea sp.]|uniref:hypothetical protein n=1 Tax=Caldilinea sp. TaxID=2293560 RepID=UPI0021DD31FE|nr:hypothetical protein [Caldilinea sp.]GIV68991.1 MAG: hypothetical protein KatS3mg048_1853 [Caldilinea sp.]